MVAIALSSSACKSSEPLPRGEAPYVPPTLPEESCTATPLGAARALRPCSTGSGAFGRWVVDELGAPAYDYALDEGRDARASYPNTEQRERREHWHAFGNDRLDAIFLPIVDGPRALVIELGRAITSAKLDGALVTVPVGATRVRLDLAMTKGKAIAFEVR